MKTTKLWILAILVLIALNLWSISWLPPMGMDDTLYSSIAHNYIREGQFKWTMVRPIARFDEKEVITGRLHLLGLTATGFLFGPSILSDRLWPLCMALISLIILWQLSKSLLGPPWVAPALALCLAEPMFFSYSHMPRPEMTMTAVFIFAIFCGMRALDDKGKLWIFLAGLSGTLAIDAHLPGIILAPSIFIALFLLRKKLYSFWPSLVWFVAGSVIGVLWYVVGHILFDPQLYLLQYEFHSIVNKIVKGNFESVIAQIPMEFMRYRQWFWGSGIRGFRIFEAILILGGIIIQIRSSNIKSRYLSLVTLCLIFIMGLAVHRKVVYYLLPLYPLFVLHMLAVFQSMLEIRRSLFLQKKPVIVSKSLSIVAVAGLLALFTFYVLQDLDKVGDFRQTDYKRYVAEITDIVPEGVVVAGSPSLWYSLGQRNNLLATPAILWAMDCRKLEGMRNMTVDEIMKRENVKFIIIDPYIRNIFNSKERESGQLLLGFIHSKCTLAKAFRNDGYIGLGECPKGELTEVFVVSDR
jgi:4-amino-4-deoxy-L-arabinose transferase-like glycosyltransferase